MANSPHSIYVSPSEARGRALLRSYASGQPGLKRLWCRAIAELHPALVIDVGANYGEFAFLPSYDPATRIVVVEANRSLYPHLERSRQAHPNRTQFELHAALASDGQVQTADFYIDPQWSGRSGAVPRGNWQHEVVPATSIDALVGEPPVGATVFKIDVEGHEPVVLAGMQRLLAGARPMLGIIEFNATSIRGEGRDPAAFLDTLRSRWTVGLIDGHGEIRILDPKTTPQTAEDLALVNPAAARVLGLPGPV